MRNLKDQRTKIFPSTTRGGKELPSSSALDSPSVLSKLATPKPASAIRSDMSHVIDDATSAMHDTYDETTSMLDTTVPLGEFLDEQLARVRENEISETNNTDESDDEASEADLLGMSSSPAAAAPATSLVDDLLMDSSPKPVSKTVGRLNALMVEDKKVKLQWEELRDCLMSEVKI